MMAKQICILSYVITIILILSNARIVSTNENNQYVTTTTATTPTPLNVIERTDNPNIVSSTHESLNTNTVATSTTTIPSSSSRGLHVASEFTQSTTLYNDSAAHAKKQIDDEQQFLVQHNTNIDTNSKQLLSPSVHDLRQHQPHNHIHSNAAGSFVANRNSNNNNHSEFMNEMKDQHHHHHNHHGPSASNQSNGNSDKTTTNKQQNGTHNNWTAMHSGNDDDTRSDEMTSMPMKIVRDNVNAAAVQANGMHSNVDAMKVSKNDEVTTIKNANKNNGNMDIVVDDGSNIEENKTKVDASKRSQTADTQLYPLNGALNERSRYLETDLDDFSDDLPFGSFEETDSNDNTNGRLLWPNDNSKFEELSLDDEDDVDSTDSNEHGYASKNDKFHFDDDSSQSNEQTEKSVKPPLASSGGGSQNIFKVTKPNKSKSIKRLAPPPPPQALHEIRLNKSPSTLSTTNEKRFINANSFRYITNLYDQYEWNADDLRNGLSRKCASDMDLFLTELANGKTWAAKGKKYSSFFSLSLRLKMNVE